MTVLSLDIEYQDGVDHDSRLHLLIQARLGYRNKGKYLIRLTFAMNIFFKKVGTLMQFYDSRPPVLWSKWPLASSLLQAIKICRQACPPSILMRFSQGSIPESLVKNNLKLTKLLNVCLNHVLFILSHFQQTLNNFVSFEIVFLQNFSGSDACKKTH